MKLIHFGYSDEFQVHFAITAFVEKVIISKNM